MWPYRAAEGVTVTGGNECIFAEEICGHRELFSQYRFLKKYIHLQAIRPLPLELEIKSPAPD